MKRRTLCLQASYQNWRSSRRTAAPSPPSVNCAPQTTLYQNFTWTLSTRIIQRTSKGSSKYIQDQMWRQGVYILQKEEMFYAENRVFFWEIPVKFTSQKTYFGKSNLRFRKNTLALKNLLKTPIFHPGFLQILTPASRCWRLVAWTTRWSLTRWARRVPTFRSSQITSSSF